MASMGEFHVEENSGKLFLVYNHPLSQTQNPNFHCCPTTRFRIPLRNTFRYPHLVLPLYWCNNKEFDANGGCDVCKGSNFGTDYYFCESHLEIYHKECVESPDKIKHPFHPEHFLKLSMIKRSNPHDYECLCCGKLCCGSTEWHMVYHCSICEIVMHPICAMKTIPFVIDPPKRHDHPLTYFPRQTSLTCNICGLLRKLYPTYVCLRCNFVAHIDCMHSPNIIKISRHHHRVSYVSSLASGEWSCGVCRQSIQCDYGAYTCDKCGDYAVHPRCALWKDVWDGEELEDVPKEDVIQDVGPFKTISEGVILHFLHDHPLLLEVNILYDEKKFCQACALPIFEGNSYSCMKCDFVLHEACANAPRIIQHALHPHALTLRPHSRYGSSSFQCNACSRDCGGFVYECRLGECTFDLDLRCGLISEPFVYESHEHPLFLTLNPKDKPICRVCKTECHKQLNCIKCNFIVCMKCATLPFKVRYKHDKHFLTILYGEEVCENNWCDVCEHELGDTDAKVFYWCKECSTTFHIECLFGKDPYFKPGQFYTISGKEVQIVFKNNLSRPLCDSCNNRCQDKIFKRDYRIACSTTCAFNIFYENV